MTGLFPDNNPAPGSATEKEILVPPGSSQDISVLCMVDGDYRCRAVVEEGARLNISAFVLAGDDSVENENPNGGENSASQSAANSNIATVNGKKTTISGRVHLSIEVDLAGPRAEFRLDGLFISSGSGRAAIDVKVNHSAPDATSRQTVKGIATDRATGEFSGMVYVARGAQHTDASQQNRNICLTDTARIFTRPGLEIYADDVRCGHGASVGQLDEEAIYYMRQRGISEDLARRIQLEGFAAEIINRCPSEDIRNIVTARVSEL